MDSVFFVAICTAFLLLPHIQSEESVADVEDAVNLQATMAQNGSDRDTGNTRALRHRFSQMLSTSKKITKTGICSFPDDPSASLALDSSPSKVPVTEVISIPVTAFSCLDRQPGYYADNDNRVACKVFHYCNGDKSIVSFICPACTLFHDEKQLCDFWYNVECNTVR